MNQEYFENSKEDIVEKLVNAKKLSLVLEVMDNFVIDDEYLSGLDISALLHMV